MKNMQMNNTTAPVMPLLMACTKPSSIEACDCEQPVIYDPVSQTVPIDMRIVGTKSLKRTMTKYKPAGATNMSSKPDQKNEIDDQKYVQ